MAFNFNLRRYDEVGVIKNCNEYVAQIFGHSMVRRCRFTRCNSCLKRLENSASLEMHMPQKDVKSHK
jgi:hypothetical protein